eukprot:scaffold11827_cov107-Isochrysis_galbana.AAC.3
MLNCTSEDLSCAVAAAGPPGGAACGAARPYPKGLARALLGVAVRFHMPLAENSCVGFARDAQLSEGSAVHRHQVHDGEQQFGPLQEAAQRPNTQRDGMRKHRRRTRTSYRGDLFQGYNAGSRSGSAQSYPAIRRQYWGRRVGSRAQIVCPITTRDTYFVDISKCVNFKRKEKSKYGMLHQPIIHPTSLPSQLIKLNS